MTTLDIERQIPLQEQLELLVVCQKLTIMFITQYEVRYTITVVIVDMKRWLWLYKHNAG